MTLTLYKLVGRDVVATSDPKDFAQWAESFEHDHRQIGDTKVGPYRVSTVFLMASTSFKGPPLVFETALFEKNGAFVEIANRYATYDEAEQGHAKVVASIEANLKL